MVTSLLIDTSDSVEGFIAWAMECEICSTRSLFGPQGAQGLLSELAILLEEGYSLKNLTCVAVTVGPGSYTGLRVGVIAAEALAYALTIPVVAVVSLELYPPPVHLHGRVASILDARSGGLYIALGIAKGKVAWEAPQLMNLEEATQVLNDVEICLSPHPDKVAARLPAPLAQKLYKSKTDPALMAQKAQKKFSSAEFSSSGLVEILYLRETQAENTYR